MHSLLKSNESEIHSLFVHVPLFKAIEKPTQLAFIRELIAEISISLFAN